MPRASDLPVATDPATDELTIIVQGGTTKQSTVRDDRTPSDVAKVADYTITGNTDDRIILMTTGGTDRSVDLPDSASDPLEIGDEFSIHKLDSGAGKVSIDRQGTDTIDGQISVALPSQYNYVKVRYLGSGLYSLVDMKLNFDTGWIANSDWTNAELTITHKLGVNMSDLIVRFYYSTDGTEANAIEPFPMGWNTGFAAGDYGLSILPIDASSFKFQTGAQGFPIIPDSGFIIVVAAQSDFYKVTVYRLK